MKGFCFHLNPMVETNQLMTVFSIYQTALNIDPSSAFAWLVIPVSSHILDNLSSTTRSRRMMWIMYDIQSAITLWTWIEACLLHGSPFKELVSNTAQHISYTDYPSLRSLYLVFSWLLSSLQEPWKCLGFDVGVFCRWWQESRLC